MKILQILFGISVVLIICKLLLASPIVMTVFIVFMALLSFALCKVSSTADKDAHEAYERWKEERKKNGRSD